MEQGGQFDIEVEVVFGGDMEFEIFEDEGLFRVLEFKQFEVMKLSSVIQVSSTFRLLFNHGSRIHQVSLTYLPCMNRCPLKYLVLFPNNLYLFNPHELSSWILP